MAEAKSLPINNVVTYCHNRCHAGSEGGKKESQLGYPWGRRDIMNDVKNII